MRNDLNNSRLIPETALRNLYTFLRDFGSYEFHLATAKRFLQVPVRLDQIIERSYEHFKLYDNRQEAFHARGVTGEPTADRRVSQDLANQCVVRFYDNREAGVSSVVVGDVQISYVDYDISPIRTTQTDFESGISGQSSGSGGADILLVSDDKRPIVGEIKAERDTTLLLALIQAITYAVELSTPNQRARLSTSYPGRFDIPEIGPYLDIYLLQINPPKDQTATNFLETVSLLAENLLSEKFVPTIVRKIVCLTTDDLPKGQPIPFAVQFAHSAMR